MKSFTSRVSTAPKPANQTLRHSVRNTHVHNILHAPLRRKLKLGSVDDPAEHEADRVADHIMRMPNRDVADGPRAPSPRLARKQTRPSLHAILHGDELSSKYSDGDQEQNRRVTTLTATAPSAELATSASGRSIQRKCSCGGNRASPCSGCQAVDQGQSKGVVEISSAKAVVDKALRGPSTPIPDHVVRSAAPHLAERIGPVRAVRGQAGDAAARSMGADAFTSDRHIVFRTGKYDESSRRGRALLAHELEHVRQQQSGGVQRGVNPANSPQEKAAVHAENDVLRGTRPSTSPNPGGGHSVSLQQTSGRPASIFVDCDSPTSGTITFIVDGASHSYDITPVCRFPEGRTYTAGITVNQRGDRLGITIQDPDPDAASAQFQYEVQSRQDHPGSFMRGVSQAQIRRGPAPATSPDTTGVPTLEDNEEVRFQVREIGADEFERLTGTTADQIPDGQLTDLGNYMSPTAGSNFPNLLRGMGAGLMAGGSQVPPIITNAPPNSTGLIWSRESHVMAFGTHPDGGANIRGYRYSVPQGARMIGAEFLRSQIPALSNNPALMRWHRGATLGVPGAVFNEPFYASNPFLNFGDQVILHQTPGAQATQQFIGQINAANNAGTYTYPRPPAQNAQGETPGVVRDLNRLGIPRNVCNANNCITVFEPHLNQALGGRALWAMHTDGRLVNVFMGRAIDGTYIPEAHGSGPLMEQALGLRPAPGQEGWSREAIFAARQDAMRNAGLTLDRVPRGRILARNLGVGVLRYGGRILLLYGAYRTTERLEAASGTPQFGRVASEEAGSWVVGSLTGIVGATAATMALEGASGGAIVCSPSGPGAFVCAAAGFAGGLILGAAGGALGHHLGGALYDYFQEGGPAADLIRFSADQLQQSDDPQVRRDGQALEPALLGNDTGSSIYLINRIMQSLGGPGLQFRF